MLDIFSSQGIEFSAEHVDPHFEQKTPHPKPGIGMVLDYLKSGELDLNDSWVIGDREPICSWRKTWASAACDWVMTASSWASITHQLVNRPRQARSSQDQRDRYPGAGRPGAGGSCESDTGIGFFDHMLDQLASHGGFRLELSCSGDLDIDEHHTVEDCALALGQALNTALGDRRGIGRYGFLLPMDESLAQVAIDLSGRPSFVFEADFPRDLCRRILHRNGTTFFRFPEPVTGRSINLQVRGENTHHMVEALFKGAGRALKPALIRQGKTLPSTKGVL